MERREFFLGMGGATISISLAGCGSDDTTGTEPSDDETGPRGPGEAVEYYDDAIELLERNSDEFREVRQQMVSDPESVDFDATAVASRTSEARSQLDRAEAEDDGSLSDEIETLQRIASYQDTLTEYNEDYLTLTRLLNTGLDEYFAGQHRPAIELLEDAQRQIEPTRSSLDLVEAELNEVQNAAERAEMSDELIQSIIITDENNTEIQIELTILEDLLPARIAEVEGDLSFERGFDAFEEESYTNARSHFSDAESHFVTGKTRLDSIAVEEVTIYIEQLIADSESLICEYEFSVDAADNFQQSANSMQNGDFEQAEQHWEDAQTNLSRIDTC